MAMVKVLTPTFFWSSPEITWLLSSQGGIHAAGPLMARPHSEGRCGDVQIGAVCRLPATR